MGSSSGRTQTISSTLVVAPIKPRFVATQRKIKTVNAFGTTQVSLVRVQPAVSAACQHSGHCRPFLANAGGTTSLLRTRSRVRVPSSLPSVVNHKTFGSDVAQQVERVIRFTPLVANPYKRPVNLFYALQAA